MLAELKPELRFVRRGMSVKGNCPFHDDQSPSFIVSPLKGVAKCFSANCNATHTHPIFFVAALMGTRFSEAVQYLRKRFGLKGIVSDALFEKVKAYEVHQEKKLKAAKFMCGKLFEAWTEHPNLGNTLGWADSAVEYLITRRLGVEPGEDVSQDKDPGGVYGVLTSRQVIGIFPPMMDWERQFQAEPDMLAWVRTYFHQYFEGFNWVGALVFVMHDEPGSVARFKFRQPNTKNFVWVEGDAYEQENDGFRGLLGIQAQSTWLGRNIGADQGFGEDKLSLSAVVTEGEFDTIQPLAHIIRHQTDDFISFALGGSSLQPLDKLYGLGIETIRIIPDMDSAGTGIVRKVLERAQSDKVAYEVFVWPEEFKDWRDPTDPEKRIKDPDEAIRYRGWKRWRHYVVNPDCYIKAYEWVYDHAERELSRIPEDDVRQRNRVALDWGRLLKNRAECDAFCNQIEKGFGIDRNTLSRDIWASNEDEASFIDRIQRTLMEHFHFIGLEPGENRKRLLVASHKGTRQLTHFVLNDEKSAEATLAGHFGAIYKFIIDNMAEPAFLTGEGEGEAPLSVEMKTKKYRMYVTLALLNIAKGLPTLDKGNRRAQGLHYVKTVNGEIKAFLVNGSDIYKIRNGENSFEVTALDGPSHEGMVFQNSDAAWLPDLVNAKGLEDTAKGADPKQLFKQLKEMIHKGWKWRHQDLDSTFLAAYSMCLSVMTIFRRQTAIILNAEASSGKSRFTSGFIGGKGFPRIHLIAHAITMQSYTAAAVRQQREGSSLCVCFEEFEDYGGHDSKSAQVRKLLELLRDMISEGGVTASIGTKNGESLTYQLQFPIVCCSIKPLRDQASLSRFVGFELVNEPNREDPQNVILDLYNEDAIKKIRKDLALGLIPHMHALREIQTDIEKEFGKGNKLPAHATARFRESLYPILAMLKFLGEDYQKFAFDFSESRKEQLARLKTTAENEQLFESLLSSSFTIANMGDRVSWATSVRNMLSDLNNLHLINQTKKGVYYDAHNEWIVVQWIEAVQGVLSQTRFREEPPTFLKHIAERSPFYVSAEMATKTKVLPRLVSDMGPGHTLDLVSVFSVKHLMEMTRQHQADTKTISTKPPPGKEEKGPPQALTPGGTDALKDKPAGPEAMGSGGDDDIIA